MNRKPVFKSKTVNSALVIIIILALNILGVGEAEIGKTYDTINQTNDTTERAKDLIGLLGAAGVIYGRMKANTKLGKGADDEKDTI